MYQQAIKKLKDEMAVDAEDNMIVEIGEFMCHWLSGHRSAAGAVLANDKTLSGAAEAVEDTVKKLSGRCKYAEIGPAAAQRIILHYFELDNPSGLSIMRGGFSMPLDSMASDSER